MKFKIEQPIMCAMSSVEEAYLQPEFYARLGELDTIGAPEVLKMAPDERDPEVIQLQVRYCFTGNLSSAARAVIDPRKLTWVDHTELDKKLHEMRFRMVPDHYQDRLECHGRHRFESSPGSRTTQIMEGEIEVRFPLVGGAVERAIIDGLKKNLVAEASIIQQWVQERES